MVTTSSSQAAQIRQGQRLAKVVSVNAFVLILLAIYLLPLIYLFVNSLKSHDQLLDSKAPLWPAERVTYAYNGKNYSVMEVPTNNGLRNLVLIKPRVAYSEFIDPDNLKAGTIRWDGYWRTLQPVYRFKIEFGNYSGLWENVGFWLAAWNTFLLAVVGEIAVLSSSILVAYGFSRFRIPKGKWLFSLMMATILIPDSITLLPTFFFNLNIMGWNGTWYPLLFPLLFGNPIYIFLLRQNFKIIPREQIEAAWLDGAGPLRILTTIIVPQCIPAIVTVALLHFFYVWNEVRLSSLYLGINPQLRPLSYFVQPYFDFSFTPEKLQAAALLMLAVAVLILLIANRFFMQNMVVTGLEKKRA